MKTKLQGRARKFLLALAGSLLLALATASSSWAAVQIGVGWSGNVARDTEEMPLVAASGATTFRVPQGAINDALVEAAAQNNVTVLAQLGGGGTLPAAGAERAAFLSTVSGLVQRYGVNGSFWSAHPGLTAKPITTWEVWNEPNLKGISPSAFGAFLNEVGATIHSASLGGSPEVLFGGILANGNLGPTSGTWEKMNGEEKGTTFTAALKYLEEAYAGFATGTTGGVANVQGIAIHPYELNEASFYTPPGGTRYNRIEAFRYAVGSFHAKMVELAGSKGGGQKALSITESGWPAAGSEWTVSEAEQAALLGQVITYAKNNEAALGLTNFNWYNFRDATGEGTEWARYCGLRAYDGHFRTAWTEFQAKAGVKQFVPQVPAIVTSAATEVRGGEVVMNGTINPHGMPTWYHFEYGPTTSYGSVFPSPDAYGGAGEAAAAEASAVRGLRGGTVYHYRLVASNIIGPTYGPDVQFTTSSDASGSGFASESSVANPRQWVYYRGENGQLWQWFWSGAGSTNVQATTHAMSAGTSAAALAHGGTPTNPLQFVYYNGTDHNIWQWYWSGSGSTNGALAGGQPIAVNTSPTAFASGSVLANPGQWIYYTGENGQIWQWFWNGAGWFNEQATAHAVATGTSPTVFASGGTVDNPRQSVYYHGTDDHIWQWFWSGSGSTNGVIPGGQLMGAGTSPMVLSSGSNPNNPEQWIYYVGEDGQLWQWFWSGLGWVNAQATTHAAEAGTTPAGFASGGNVDNPHQWVYYVGADHNIWQWFWSGAGSTNEVLAGGEPAAAGTKLTVINGGSNPNNPEQWIYYKGADGKMWQWYWSGGGWVNQPL